MSHTITPMHKWFMDIGNNISVGQWEFKNISNDSFGADGSQNPATKSTVPAAEVVPSGVKVNVKSEADLRKETASVLSKIIYLPYMGLGVGYFGAAYIGNKRNSSTMGYLGWMALGAILGMGGGFALAAVLTTKEQMDGTEKLLDNVSGSASSTGSAISKDDQIKTNVNNLIDKIIAVAPKISKDDAELKKNLTPEKIAQGKAMIASQLPVVMAKLTDKEKDIAVDVLAAVDGFVDKITADAEKGTKQDAMVIFGYLGQLQQQMTKKYSQKELDEFFGKLNSMMPQNAPSDKK